MMRRLLFILGLFLAVPSVESQGLIVTTSQSAAPASYTGPGDIVSAATAAYSLRAYSAAIAAAGTQAIVDLRRLSDNATCTAKVATSGTVDLTVGTPCNSSTQTVTAWINNASSCTGAIAGTTLTVASCTAGNLTTGLRITEAGVITDGTMITALGTGAGGAGTYTVSISQTAASGVFTAPGYAAVSTLYDQSGNGSDELQATAGAQPFLVLSGGPNNLPFVIFNGFQTMAATIADIASPHSASIVWVRLIVATRKVLSTSSGNWFIRQAAANLTDAAQAVSICCSSTAADLAWHASQTNLNGASSEIYLDCSRVTGSTTARSTGTIMYLSPDFFIGGAAEFIMWPSAISNANEALLNASQHTAWGF